MAYTLSLYRVIPYGTNMPMNTRMSAAFLCDAPAPPTGQTYSCRETSVTAAAEQESLKEQRLMGLLLLEGPQEEEEVVDDVDSDVTVHMYVWRQLRHAAHWRASQPWQRVQLV
jgi:hypothetical protein